MESPLGFAAIAVLLISRFFGGWGCREVKNA